MNEATTRSHSKSYLNQLRMVAVMAAGIWFASPVHAIQLDFTLPGATEVASRESFNVDWRFARFTEEADSNATEPKAQQLDFNDTPWRKLNLPHDWGIEGPFDINLPAQTGKRTWFGIGWYRKSFFVPATDAGKRIFLDFDGAMSDSTVYLNGQKVGGWAYGYSSFRVELTDKIKFGAANLIAVRLDNKPNSSRWYPGGGIYRNTWLVETDPIHIAHWGVNVTTPEIAKDKAVVQLQVTVDNQSAASAAATVQADIWELGATPVKVASSATTKTELTASSNAICKLSATVDNPKLWDLEKPNLYCALTTVSVGGKIVDTMRTVFGIRTVTIDAAQGVQLNRRKVPINGVCMHHDLGALGSAFNTRAAERQLEILKSMGCNSIRTSHNPPAPELLDLCDRMGFLVLDEAFDTWTTTKTPNDYGRFFREWHVRDVTAMVRRDHNHPSVYMWSAGNEISEQGRGEAGMAVLRGLVAIFHREDPGRLVTVGCNNVRATNSFFRGMDVLGLNYKPSAYAAFHSEHPDVPLLGSETSSCISSRGEYFFPVSNDKKQGAVNFQISSYDLTAVRWGNIPDDEFIAQDQNRWIVGEYVWTGFDYLGEPTPWNKDVSNLLNYQTEKARQQAKAELAELGTNSPSRSSYFGIIDLAGFPKDRFYLYQARWRPDFPMAHILPHWNWPERVGQVTPVQVYTSGDAAELFLNGKSLGKKTKGQFEYRLRWNDVVYEPGELKVVAYKAGKIWAQETVNTAGTAAKISLVPDRKVITADGRDLSYVTVTITDAQGRMVPRSKNLVKFSVTGPGELVAVDNGDATSLEPFQTNQVKAFNGLSLAIVRAKPGQSGEIRLTATAEGLQPATAAINGQKYCQPN